MVKLHGCTFAFLDEKYRIISQIHQKKGDLAGYNVFYWGRLLICKGIRKTEKIPILHRLLTEKVPILHKHLTEKVPISLFETDNGDVRFSYPLSSASKL